MAERIITLFFLFINAGYLFYALQLTFGTLQSPKSGFLPLITAAISLIITIILLLRQWSVKIASFQDAIDWTKFIFVVIGLLFYITSLNTIGYFTATFMTLFYFFKIGDMTDWLLPFMMATGSSAVFYLVFNYYLAIPLP